MEEIYHTYTKYKEAIVEYIIYISIRESRY